MIKRYDSIILRYSINHADPDSFSTYNHIWHSHSYFDVLDNQRYELVYELIIRVNILRRYKAIDLNPSSAIRLIAQ
jgi:hypothetical protein